MSAVKINSHEGECHNFVYQGEGLVAKIIRSDLKAKSKSLDSFFYKSILLLSHTDDNINHGDTRVITPHRYDHMCSNVKPCLQ